MKRRGMKLLLGLATAGMFMAAGAIGVQSVGGITTAETVETVEHKVERNEDGPKPSGISGGGMTGRYTGYKSIDDKIKSLPAGYGYAKFYMAGYDGIVLGVAIPGSILSDGTAMHVEIFIMRNNEVYCVGDIDKIGRELRIKNGVLCGVIYGDDVVVTETYLISSDERSLRVRDYLRNIWYDSTKRNHYDGFVDHSEINRYDEYYAKYFSTHDYNEVPEADTGWDIERYKPIKFTIKK